VLWATIGSAPFREPFFAQTIAARLHRRPRRVLETTDIATLHERAAAQPGLELTGLIFHMARCGSTLVTQMLAADPRHAVLSEPPMLGDLLGRDSERLGDQRIRCLDSALRCMAVAGPGVERFYLKTPSSLVHELPSFRLVAPRVPALFVFRDPVEVAVSLLEAPDVELGSNFLALPEARRIDLVVGRLTRDLQAALRHRAELRFVHYPDIAARLTSDLAPVLGVDSTDSTIARMRAAAEQSSKRPTLQFVADSASKRTRASNALTEAVQAELLDLYRTLCSL
jgi:hypothetical protein